MMTFDRYLLRRYMHAVCILFVCLYGLFVVIDSFTNIDAFQEGGRHAGDVLAGMAVYYLYQSSPFFDMVGPILSVIGVMVVFAILGRHSEVYPILAAGIPTRRLLVPIVTGMVLVNLALIGNQEFIIPSLSNKIQAPRSKDSSKSKKVQPVYDHATLILISGKKLLLHPRRLKSAKFVLPANKIANELTTLTAREATFHKGSANRPSGWNLMGVTPRYNGINLTHEGKKIVLPTINPDELFVVTDVNFDQLYNRSRSYQFVSTPELVRLIRNPASSLASVRVQTLYLHNRLMRPLINLTCILIVVPLVLRKESKGMVGNMAICTGVLSLVLGVAQASNYLGQANLISLDLAAWSPLMFTGTLGAWLTGLVQT